MHDFGRILRQSLTSGAVIFLDQVEDLVEFTHCLRHSWHQRVATRDGGNLSNPAVGLVPIDYEL